MEQINRIKEFKDNASLVSSVLHEAQTIQDALKIAVSICMTKSPCITLTSPDNNEAGSSNDNTKHPKRIYAPSLDPEYLNFLESLCQENNIILIKESLRGHGGGIDMGVTTADYGIAETGTLVVESDSEEKRLATMLSEIHVAMLPKSKIRATALDMADELEALTSKPSSYTAFITGPSRTADIERVLAIGVHGPLELHIILLNDVLLNDDASASDQKNGVDSGNDYIAVINGGNSDQVEPGKG